VSGQQQDIWAEISPENLPQTPREVHLLAFYVYGIPAGWSREKCERAEQHAWPLAYFKIHGIGQGRQWAVLGYLAARYARDFTTDELAHELWEAVQASEQNPRDPWRWHQIRDCARRAKRFIGRADALADARLQDSGAIAWALAASRAAQASRPWAAGAGRRGRKAGARKPGVRP
jgi:hypothetical protein